jgi:hypothetical protein
MLRHDIDAGLLFEEELNMKFEERAWEDRIRVEII